MIFVNVCGESCYEIAFCGKQGSATTRHASLLAFQPCIDFIITHTDKAVLATVLSHTPNKYFLFPSLFNISICSIKKEIFFFVMESQKFNLCWNEFDKAASTMLKNLVSDQIFTDVTISCDSDPRRIYRGADKIFTVSKCKNWFC